MSPQTVKMLTMFFLATALLNITNYLFYWLYETPSHRAMKLKSISPEEINPTRFTTKSRVTRTIQWTAHLSCKDNPKSAPNEVRSGAASSEEDSDYRDQSSEISNFYYYNGIRKGPVVCPQKPPGLGPVNIEDTVSLESIERLYAVLESGGIYKDAECAARQNVAVIIPYRGQKTQLLEFLYFLHPVLMKQQLEYQIFVIEQCNKSLALNLGKLFNAGFTEAQRMKQNGGWQCIVFHEPDLLPVDSRNLYHCSRNPHQLVTIVGNKTYELEIGGAIAIKPKHFSKINGFSNLYVENAAVYDDLRKRLAQANYSITKSITFGKYVYSKQSNGANQTRFQTIQTSSPLNLIDGLSTLTYTLNNIELKPTYTLIEVDIDLPSVSITGAKEKIWNKLINQATMVTTKKAGMK